MRKTVKVTETTDINAVHEGLEKSGYPDCLFVFSTDEARRRFNSWLAPRLGVPVEQLN
jgi:hypothetical protein